MRRYQFRSYRSPSGEDEVRFWYGRQSYAAKAEMTITAMYLRDQHADGWIRPDYADLKGDLIGIGELRAIVGDMHYRIFGFRDDIALEFTMLRGVRKKKRFDYKDVARLLQRRKADIIRERATNSQPGDWIFLT